jgi:hypothetical protein
VFGFGRSLADNLKPLGSFPEPIWFRNLPEYRLPLRTINGIRAVKRNIDAHLPPASSQFTMRCIDYIPSHTCWGRRSRARNHSWLVLLELAAPRRHGSLRAGRFPRFRGSR